jgi:UDPglucose 6-dehydrogenase
MIKRIVVCGLGKLGAPLAAVFANSGIEVTGLDLDQSKVDAINADRAPVEEPDLQMLIVGAREQGRLRSTTKAAEAAQESDACIFITPTPSLPNGLFDNTFLLKAIESVASVIRHEEKPYLFVITSTVTPGTCNGEILPLLNLTCKRPFHLVYKPEFIALGNVIHGLEYPDFHLFGQSSEEAGKIAAKLYADIAPIGSDGPFRFMSLVEAELAKIALNSFVTMKISFANQLAMVADKFGADPHVILDAIGTDHRIGMGALKPGLPFGGPCFPRDSRMFKAVAHTVHVEAPLAIATDEINFSVVDEIAKRAQSFGGTIGILGTAYKEGTAVTDESPGLRIKNLLPGRVIKTHDPMAPHSHTLEEVVACDILIVATPWPEYAAIPCLPNWDKQVLIDPMRVIRSRTVRLERKVAAE